MEYINYKTLFKRTSEINDNRYVFKLLMLKKEERNFRKFEFFQ